MKQRGFLYDPSLYAVIAVNLYLITEYLRHRDSIHSIIFFFWMQNVAIGFFNFLDILTVKNVQKGSFPASSKGRESKGCSALFFLVHYGAFQLGYLVYLLVHLDVKLINWHYLYLSFWILLVGMLLNFIITRKQRGNKEMNLSLLFFLPYLRIIPMHLMIFFPILFHLSSYTGFLALKMLCDVLMHIATHKMAAKKMMASGAVA